jgi:hypothetical protein
MSKKRERAEGDSDSELDATAQQAADAELLIACFIGTVAHVKAALQKGASFVAVDAHGQTGLSLACQRQPVDDVVQIIEILLRKRCPVGLGDKKGWNALHHVCVRSSAKVAQLLIAADKSAAARVTDTYASCLLLRLKNKSVEESLKIATLLLQSGCYIDAADVRGKTPLMRAAQRGRLEMLAFLISRGARLDATDMSNKTALHWACWDGAVGHEAIALLCRAGASVTAKAGNGFTAFDRALESSGPMAEAMVPFLPAGFVQGRVVFCTADPVGSMACAVKCGATVSRTEFASEIEEWLDNEGWVHLRNGMPLFLNNSPERDALRALTRSGNAELWKWASSEPQMQQHPITGDTVFHLLCLADKLTVEQKLVVLADLKKHYRNPLTPNYRNELCITLAREPEVKKALQEYACWQPHWLSMEWFGPLFQQRAFALLLVCYRIKREHPKALEGLNRDIRHLLVKYASRVECIYVPSVP